MNNGFDIVIVEDEDKWCNVISELASMFGYKAVVTQNPREVTGLLEQGARLLITDIRMTPHSGFVLIKKIRRSFPDIPIIIVTGFPTGKLNVQARAWNVQKVLVKPFTITDLWESILELLKNKNN